MPTFPAYITATIAPRSRYIVGTPGSATLQIFAEPPVIPVGVGSLSSVSVAQFAQECKLSPEMVASLCTVSAPTWQEIVAPPAPADVGWWKLNETSGTVAADSSGNNRHATVTGPSWNDGLTSDGTGNGIAVATVGVNIRTQPVSYSLWFTPVTRSNQSSGLVQPFPPNVLSNDIFGLGGIGIGINVRDTYGGNNTVIAAYFYNSELPAYISSGVRRHFAVVGDATSSKLYIDGNLISTSSSLQNFASSSGTLRFNYTNEDTNYQQNRFSKGTLRDVRVYKRALTAGEVQNTFLQGPAP